MTENKQYNAPFLVLFAGISILLFYVFTPFFIVLSLAAVAAVLLHKPYEKLTRLFGGWRDAAALLTVGLMLVFVIVPLFFLGGQIFQEVQNVFMSMYGSGPQYLHFIQQTIEEPIRHTFPGFVFNISAYVENALAIISNNLGSLVYQTIGVAFETFLMLVALFFFLRDGRSILASLVDVSPLGEEVTSGILNKMYQTIGAVMKGTVVNALIRWVFISIAFTLFGIPNAVLWGGIGGVIGAIPGLGTPFAFIPAIIYAYLQGDILATLGIAAFGIVTVILVDNILTAYFFGKGFSISPVFVLFSILGGIFFFGPFGFILGPLVLSVFLSVARVYSAIERTV